MASSYYPGGVNMTTELALELTESRLDSLTYVLRWLFANQPDADEYLIGEALERVFELQGIVTQLKFDLPAQR